MHCEDLSKLISLSFFNSFAHHLLHYEEDQLPQIPQSIYLSSSGFTDLWYIDAVFTINRCLSHFTNLRSQANLIGQWRTSNNQVNQKCFQLALAQLGELAAPS